MPDLRRSLVSAAIAASAAACAAGDEAAPTLEVTSPARGTMQTEEVVTVTGRVADAGDAATGVARVTVNGLEADVAADGAFAITFAVAPGVELIETVAVDAAGNEARDVRAVLAGPLAPTSGTVGDALAAHLGPEALTVIAGVVADTVEAMDLAALAGGDGPLVALGGDCLGADVHLVDVAVGDVGLALAPGDGAIATAITIDDLDVTLRADYRVGCADQTTPIRIRAARVTADGALGLAATGGALDASLDGLEVTLAGLDLEADGLPGELFDLLEGPIESLAPAVVEAVATDAVPGLVEAMLADLAGASWSLPVLGRDLGITVAPAEVRIERTGAFVALDGALHVAGDADGRYLSTPAPAAAAVGAGGAGLAVAVADDTVNQLLAGMWASGAIELTLPIERGDPLQLLLGGNTRGLEVSASLPPTVAIDASGDLRLVIGDLVVRCVDDDGGEVKRIALSLSTTLGVELVDGARLSLRLGEPGAWAQVLAQRADEGDEPIEGRHVEALIEALWPVLGADVNHLLAAVPVPSIGGVAMTGPTLDGRAGFVVLETGVAPVD